MTREETRVFAEQWAAAWNERALETVLAHFDDRVTFTSPTAVAVVGCAAGDRLCGRPRRPEKTRRPAGRATRWTGPLLLALAIRCALAS